MFIIIFSVCIFTPVIAHYQHLIALKWSPVLMCYIETTVPHSSSHCLSLRGIVASVWNRHSDNNTKWMQQFRQKFC